MKKKETERVPQNHLKGPEPVPPVALADETGNEEADRNSLVLPEQVLPSNLFVIPYAGPVVYPTLMAPMLVTMPRYIATIEETISRQRWLGLVLPRGDELRPDLKIADLHAYGVVVKILKRLKMPDGTVSLLVHAMKRFHVEKVLSEDPHLIVQSRYLDDLVEKSNEMDALTRSVIGHVKKLSETNPFFTDEMRLAMINAPGPGTVADLVTFALSLPREEAQSFLETISVKARFNKLLTHLKREQDVADLQKKIQSDVNSKVSTMQREFFLREQLKVIKKELGIEEDGKDRNARTFRDRIEEAGMPPEAKKIALEELAKFETLSEQSPEFNVLRNYLDTVCSLPWSKETVDNLHLKHARDVLEKDHFGLEKVKERIIEFLAVRKLTQERKERPPRGSIICLVGPPGVGKTSIGKSIAKTLGRSFYRFSLGGMRDEAEIKGHRRTYVGALPGKILLGMKRAGTKNPVIMLDEIDKLAQSYQGDPASALLEVLDPEQNSSFLDHYLDIPYDLSKVLFVVTANTTSTIPAPLLDRMEVIEIAGYTLEEKEKIASRHLIPKVFREHGLKSSQIRIEKEALRAIMADYAREPGVRSLQQMIEKIARKAAARIVGQAEIGGEATQAILIREAELRDWLGPKRFYNELAERITVPGVVVGLAWTALGGDILFIEATDLPGTGALKLTGQMGEVMNESGNIAWSYVKRRVAAEKSLPPDFFKKRDLHLHIPAGAIPKDGPSAGVTMATALYSLLTGRKFKQKFAMTGELSLVGKVLPVGGIKEKVLAAKRAGITTLILPRLNEKDMADIPEYARRGMQFHFVSHVNEVFDWVLEDAGISRIKTRLVAKAKRSLSSASGRRRSLSIRRPRHRRGRLAPKPLRGAP